MKEPPDTNIQVVYHDSDTNTEYVSAATLLSISVRNITHARPKEIQTVTPSRSILRTSPRAKETRVRSLDLPGGILLRDTPFISLTSTQSGSVLLKRASSLSAGLYRRVHSCRRSLSTSASHLNTRGQLDAAIKEDASAPLTFAGSCGRRESRFSLSHSRVSL